MSQRLQVLLDVRELAELRRIAKLRRTTVAEWVRQAIRAARQDAPTVDPRLKLAAVREAYRGAYPAPDLAQLLHETERGYLGGGERP